MMMKFGLSSSSRSKAVLHLKVTEHYVNVKKTFKGTFDMFVRPEIEGIASKAFALGSSLYDSTCSMDTGSLDVGILECDHEPWKMSNENQHEKFDSHESLYSSIESLSDDNPKLSMDMSHLNPNNLYLTGIPYNRNGEH